MASESPCQNYRQMRFSANYLYEKRSLLLWDKSLIKPKSQWLWLSVPFYNMTMVLAKFSALTLFTRLFRPRPFRLATYILMGCLVVIGLWTTLSGFFFCNPVHAFWSPSEEVRKIKCLPSGPVWFTNAALQTVTDLVILILPMPLLWRLQLPKRQKWGIIVVFGLGIMSVEPTPSWLISGIKLTFL